MAGYRTSLALALGCALLPAPVRAESALTAAADADRALVGSPEKLKLRHHSERVIRAWQRAQRGAAGPDLRAALDGERGAWERLARWSGLDADRRAVAALEQKLRALPVAKRVTPVDAPPPMAVDAPAWLPKVEIEVEGSTANIVLPIEGALDWDRHLLPAKNGRGARIYFDISPVIARREALITTSIELASVRQLRVGQFDGDTVRVVLDLEPGRPIPDRVDLEVGSPTRIVVGPKGKSARAMLGELRKTLDELVPTEEDLLAIVEELKKERATEAAPPAAAEEEKDEDEEPSPLSIEGLKRSTRRAIAQQRRPNLKIRRVVVDAGHGGHDTGAIGKNGVAEKSVNLKIAKALGRVLEKRLGVEVVYTRSTDEFVSLGRRVEIANAGGADLFISVHANAHKNRAIHGVETYFLDTTTSRYAKRLARRENTPGGPEGPLDGPSPDVGIDAEDDGAELAFGGLGRDARLLLANLAMRSASEESRRLAGYVQSSIVGRVGREHRDVKDLGVKKALFYVLLGARMPSVLVETGFMSHEREAKRLSDPAYQRKMAEAIADGVRRFVADREAVASRL